MPLRVISDFINTQMQEKLLKIVLKNESIKKILDAAEEVDLPQWYLAGGSIAQTVWNLQCDLPIEYGISDYDLIYFDKTQEKTEKELRLQNSLSGVPVEIVNQAFVHTWLPKYLGHTMEPYSSTENVLRLNSATVICVGIKKENGEYKIFAPYGLEDIFSMTIRPVKGLFTEEMYKSKTQKWKAKWPKIKVGYWNKV